MMNFAQTGATVSISATTSSGNQALPGVVGTAGKDILVHNSGTTLAFVRFGKGTQTATTADTPVPGGAYMVLRVAAADSDNVAAIMSSGTATIYFTPGNGM